MTLEELLLKWRVGPCEVDAKTYYYGQVTTIKMPSWEHSAPLGDFLKDYMDHRAISWWKKGWDWKIVESTMRNTLNQIHIKFYGRL